MHYLWTGMGVAGWVLALILNDRWARERSRRRYCENEIVEETRKRAKTAQEWYADSTEWAKVSDRCVAAMDALATRYEALAEKHKDLKKQMAGA